MNETIIKALWRIGRGAFITALTQTLALRPDWTNQENAIKLLSISFGTGFLFAVGKAIREKWGDEDPSKGVINKLPV